MKNKHLFFQADRCSGCRLCVTACSLVHSGLCGESNALIQILDHPRFGTSFPVIKEACLCSECQGECTEVCTPGVLTLVDEEASIKLMTNEKWHPVPVLQKEIEK
jgi:ferredoxin